MSGSSISENELNSDVFFTPAPGPGGDVPNPSLTKKDILKLKSELENMLDTISNCDLETLNDDDLKRLREDFKKCPINNVIRYDLTNIRLDLQNKYHAELEIMNEQHENTIDMMNVEFEKKLKEMEEELMKVKSQVQVYNVSSSVQEVVRKLLLWLVALYWIINVFVEVCLTACFCLLTDNRRARESSRLTRSWRVTRDVYRSR